MHSIFAKGTLALTAVLLVRLKRRKREVIRNVIHMPYLTIKHTSIPKNNNS